MPLFDPSRSALVAALKSVLVSDYARNRWTSGIKVLRRVIEKRENRMKDAKEEPTRSLSHRERLTASIPLNETSLIKRVRETRPDIFIREKIKEIGDSWTGARNSVGKETAAKTQKNLCPTRRTTSRGLGLPVLKPLPIGE